MINISDPFWRKPFFTSSITSPLLPSFLEAMEEPTVENGLEFIAQVKQAFSHPNQGNRSKKYDHFARALVEFNEQKISPERVVAKLQSLFQGHDDLLRGFEIFLPESKTGVAVDFKRKRISGFECAQRQSSYEFLNKVKNRFASSPGSYKEFLDAMVGYKRGKMGLWDLCEEIVDLFLGHHDLLHEFESLFVDGDEKLRTEVEKLCGFILDDRLNEMEVTLCNLRTSMACAEKAMQVPNWALSKFVEDEFVGFKLMGIKKVYGEFSEDVILDLKQDPEGALPVILHRFKEKEEAVSMDRSAALRFLGEIRVLHGKRKAKKTARMD